MQYAKRIEGKNYTVVDMVRIILENDPKAIYQKTDQLRKYYMKRKYYKK